MTTKNLLLGGSTLAVAAAVSGALLLSGGTAVGQSAPAASAPKVAESSFGVFKQPSIGMGALTSTQREAVTGLGQGLLAGRAAGAAFAPSRATAQSSALASSAQAIAQGAGDVHRVVHPAGVTVVLVREGSALCFNDAPTGATDTGGSCGAAEPDPAAPPASVTQEDNGKRVVALIPDGATGVTLTQGDGTRTPVTVQDNVAAARVPSARQLSWTDASGQARRITFGLSNDDASPAARADRAAELDAITGK